MNEALTDCYKGKKVLVTGHTGFKGTWLTLWLKSLGAHVIGYSLPPEEKHHLFNGVAVKEQICHIEGDIVDFEAFKAVVDSHQPDIIFHLAAQAILLEGYKTPKETFDTNVGGTVNILEAVRTSASVRALVVATTDKCYENAQWIWGYRENDPLGGKDPYSASKSMAEIAVAAYRASFFQGDRVAPYIATVRAGNIIGGGDFSQDRIVPDIIKALEQKIAVDVRNPFSTRPWLYVLDALYGYLLLGSQLLSSQGKLWSEAWNFGPWENRGIAVKELVAESLKIWGEGEWRNISTEAHRQQEMALLRLNWDKAAHRLGWAPKLDWKKAVEQTISWYRSYSKLKRSNRLQNLQQLCFEYIQNYSTLQIRADCESLSMDRLK